MASLLAFLFGLPSARRNPRSNPPPAPIPSTPDICPVPTQPNPHRLPPLKNWCHPFKDNRDPLSQLTHMANAIAGYYPVGISGLFHGGVHFDSGTASALDQSSVHCLADGEVVAYRVDTRSPTTRYFIEELTLDKPFSRNFVLVRHRMQPPNIDGSPDTPPSLTFYSFYMHLRDWEQYRDDASLARPTFWPESPTLRVKQTANDARAAQPARGDQPAQPERRGLRVRHSAQGKTIDLLPHGAPVSISGTGNWRKLENSLGPAALINADGTLKGYIAASLLQSIGDNECIIRSSKERVNVRAEPSLLAGIPFELPTGSIVTVSGEGDFLKLERVNQYVPISELAGELEPQVDRIVVLDEPVPIKAGDLIGHLGDYQDKGAEHPEQKLHLEVFTGDDMDLFLQDCRAWAERLPAKEKTWLKLAKGTPVVPHQDNPTGSLLKVWSATSPLSAADLLVPKRLLEGLRGEDKIIVPAKDGRNARHWYRLHGLLHDADHNPLDGWVCEEVGVTPWFSPWSWEGYDVIVDYGTERHAMASFYTAIKRFTDAQRERFKPLADKDISNPMKQRLYDIIDRDRDRDGHITAKELKAALRLPAHAQAISQMILYKESEWFHSKAKWDGLDELIGHSGSTPYWNWEADKERIEQISWWKEVAEKVGLPSWGKPYHFHSIGLSVLFKDSAFEFTLGVMKQIYERLGSSRNGDLQEIADELNKNIEFFKLNTPLRRAHFFAQILQETGEGLAVEEDFSYGVSALINLFSYFRSNPEEARRYGYKIQDGKIKENGSPMSQADYEAIANGAYGARNELGNQGVSSGDGWKYRGRGLKQLTGLYNYRSFQNWHSKFSAQWPNENPNFVDNPDLLLRMKCATRSAVSFWLNNRLYEIADKGAGPEIVDLITEVVNKRTDSYPQRRRNFIKLWVAETLK